MRARQLRRRARSVYVIMQMRLLNSRMQILFNETQFWVFSLGALSLFSSPDHDLAALRLHNRALFIQHALRINDG